MLLLTVSEFRSNISKYLKLAVTEHVAVKSPCGIFNISLNNEIRTNPSPTNDSWFDVPENLASIERGQADAEARRVHDWEDVKNELGL